MACRWFLIETFLFLFVGSLCAQTEVHVKKAGTLSSLLTREQQDTCTSLVIKGKLNSSDFRLLRSMAGYCESKGKGEGKLTYLDLTDARIVKDKNPFMSLDAAECGLAGTALPDRYFPNVTSAPSELWNGERSIFQYKPKFFLGYSRKDAVTERTAPAVEYDCKAYAPLMVDKESEGDFRFALGITDALWHEMNVTYRVTSFKGHRITRTEGNRYVLHAHLLKNVFSADMFYGCKHLREVVLPCRMKQNLSVMDDTACYRIVSR